VPFTRAEALAAGVTDLELSGARYQQVLRGVHVLATVEPTLVLRSLAALTIAPKGAVVTHHTAARLWGGIPPDSSDIHLTIPHLNRPKIDALRPHRVKAMPGTVPRRGLPVTSPERTFLDMGRWSDLVDLVVLGDSFVRAGVTTPERLRTAARDWTGTHRALVIRAASFVRDNVDSPMESRLRMLIVLAGLPEPVVNFQVLTVDGRVQYRIDLSFPDQRLGIEFDGRHHIEREGQWEGDLLRREDLEAQDWKFVVVVGSQVYGEPGVVLARIEAAMGSRGIGVPALLSPEWHRHFPGRAAA
jgi:very-short-patch-repair endonuclease